jgi:hypothetical protein
MKTTNTIHNFLNENNPEKLKEFVGLFNPAEFEIMSQYNRLCDKLSESISFGTKDKSNTFNNLKINQNLTSIIKSDGLKSFVLHKINSNIKILYQSYNSENDCCGELHFFKNKLFLASFSYPRLINGHRLQFINTDFGIKPSNLQLTNFSNISDSSHNVILIENGAVLKVHYFNKDTLISLHQ